MVQHGIKWLASLNTVVGNEPFGSIHEGMGYLDQLESKKFQKDSAPQNLYGSHCVLLSCCTALLINYALYI
jgi:hypothetical protein